MSATTDERSAPLARLQHRIEEVLSVFEGSHAPAAEAIAGAWERTSDAFEDYRTACAATDAALTPELQAQTEHVLRLHAVAVSVVTRHREALVVELDRLADARARLRELAHAPGAGRSCNVTG